MEKKEKQNRQRFKTQQEREELTRIRKRQNKRDQRIRDKAKKDAEMLKSLNLIPIIKAFRKQFRKNFYLGLRYKVFNKFLTLTCKDTVSLNWLISKSKSFIDSLKASGILGNYFKVFEHEGGNYHVHILMSASDDDTLKDLTDSWKYGNTKIVDVVDQNSKEAHIYYCTKQLNPDNHSITIQRLIDSWDLDLVKENLQPGKSIVANDSELASNINVPGIDACTNTPMDLPLPVITCNSVYAQYKKIAYRFFLWLALTCLSFSSLKTI